MFTVQDTTEAGIDTAALVIPLDKILVADRYRKDLGDVSGLKQSIANIGLLNPITVQEYYGGFKLIAGERRLRSHVELGLSEIPARVARDIADARDALVAERDENTERKEMLPSEKVALGMAIEEMEKPAATDRMLAGKTPCVPGNTGSDSGHKSRDTAAEAVGLSPSTYTRLKTVVNLSTDASQSEEVREAAKVAVEVIDAGGAVRGEYDRVKEVRRKTESATTEMPATETSRPGHREEMRTWHQSLADRYPLPRLAFEAEGRTRHSTVDAFATAARDTYGIKYRFTEKAYAKHAEQSQDWLERSSTNIEVALDVLGHIDFSTITKEQAEEALQRLDVTRQLNIYIRSLKEII